MEAIHIDVVVCLGLRCYVVVVSLRFGPGGVRVVRYVHPSPEGREQLDLMAGVGVERMALYKVYK